MALSGLRKVTFELSESYRRNRGDIQGIVFRHYPEFVLNPRVHTITDEVVVFAFHSIGPVRFERQLRHLTENGYRVLESADALYDRLVGTRPIQPNSILLTFDDGRESLYTVAFPLLKRYGFHAVAFIVPSFVGKPHFCTWEQLREMQASGVIDCQSHTLFHRFAPDWPRVVPCLNGTVSGDPQEMARYPTMVEDFRRAEDVIEKRLGHTVRHLCYPDYDGTESSIAASKETGYVSNFWGVIPGRRTNRRGDDPFRIVRIVDDYLFCLPGSHRESVGRLLAKRARHYVNPLARRVLGGARSVEENAGPQR